VQADSRVSSPDSLECLHPNPPASKPRESFSQAARLFNADRRAAPLLPACCFFVGGKGASGERSDSRRERSRVGGGNVEEFCSDTSHQPPPRPKRMATAFDLRRRRAGHHQHREQSSPPKPQTRVAAGPAIRAAESQISSDSICVVDSAVAFLEIKSPLSTMLCYRRAQPTVEKHSPISLLQGAE
jgi:hypothetical protein